MGPAILFVLACLPEPAELWPAIDAELKYASCTSSAEVDSDFGSFQFDFTLSKRAHRKWIEGLCDIDAHFAKCWCQEIELDQPPFPFAMAESVSRQQASQFDPAAMAGLADIDFGVLRRPVTMERTPDEWVCERIATDESVVAVLVVIPPQQALEFVWEPHDERLDLQREKRDCRRRGDARRSELEKQVAALFSPDDILFNGWAFKWYWNERSRSAWQNYFHRSTAPNCRSRYEDWYLD